jgi:hypothetical protein
MLLGRVSWIDELVVCPCEKLGDSRQSQVILEFSKFIFVQGLVDILLVKGNCSWSNN